MGVKGQEEWHFHHRQVPEVCHFDRTGGGSVWRAQTYHMTTPVGFTDTTKSVESFSTMVFSVKTEDIKDLTENRKKKRVSNIKTSIIICIQWINTAVKVTAKNGSEKGSVATWLFKRNMYLV